MRVVFKRWKWEKYSYNTNPEAVITIGNTEDCIEFPDGKGTNYSITVRKKSIYNTPLCYLNILNPFMFLLGHKTTFNLQAEAEAVLTSKQVEFYSKKDGAYLELVLPDGGTGDKISCTADGDISDLHIKIKSAPPKVRQRYVITKIANAVLWFIAALALLLIPDSATEIGASIAVALITGGVAAERIYTVLKAKKRHESPEDKTP